MTEIWKLYKETYNRRWGVTKWEVSNLGRVKKNGQLTNPKLSGYYYIGRFRVHRMVAEVFIPNPENKPCVDHINGNKLDNRACNLRWVTYKENMNNPLTVIQQIESHKNINKGINHPMYGKQQSKETINKRVEKLKGHKNWQHGGWNHTEEHKMKQSEIMKNKHRVYDNPEHTTWHMENNA